ncbi:metallophosphoesterase [Pseudomonas putida]|uniref:metallophosphoesterase family protein n=1 Tax=Pseudomonas putida TaxID=303 RepID=UPI002D1F7751|nr:metallophosphoesterase [Pseudomonas putida]MEB3901162.1 metallophosphoesterase [Pseudomonas putida]
MTSPASLRIAIATDLHYLQDEDGGIYPQVCVDGSKIDPMEELIEIISSADCPISPSADIVLCPGDITTRACIKSFKKGWEDLKRLQSALGASQLIAATGNHEIISRGDSSHAIPGNAESAIKPFEHLIVAEDYPAKFTTRDQKWIYWGRGFEVVTGGEWVVVTLNSCHYHNSLLPNEYERGRIGDAALTELESKLKELSSQFKYKIVMLHHPPTPHEEFDVDLGRTSMYNGELLVQTLENTCDDWLILHGHKHLSRLTKASGAEYAPIILGAASFGAMVTGDLAGKTRNQFYILELRSSEGNERMKGTFEALSWDGSEWGVTCKINHGLPHGCGFDLENPFKSKKVAQSIKQFLEGGEQPFFTWAELKKSIGALSHIMPKDIKNLCEILDALGVRRVPADGAWFPEQLWVDKK